MEKVNNSTGEVSNFFRTQYNCDFRTPEDCSNPFQKRYKEIPPYAVDVSTGKIVNKKSVAVLVPDEDFNIDEYIQSFKEECDIYTILEKFALTGCTDTSLINKNVMSFGDISELPDNFNDLNEYFESANKKINEFSKELAQKVLDNDISVDSIQKDLNAQIEAAEASAKKEEVKE